jgi:hypothetical protein
VHWPLNLTPAAGGDDPQDRRAEDVREDFSKRVHESSPPPGEPETVVDVDVSEDFTQRGRTTRPQRVARNR